jgi:hypothetical protein
MFQEKAIELNETIIYILKCDEQFLRNFEIMFKNVCMDA